MPETEQCYDINELADLEILKREYNIPREMAPAVLEVHGRRRSAGLWSLTGAESLDANQASTFNAKAETLTDRPAYRNAFQEGPVPNDVSARHNLTY
jgi:putative SOS response-associated peptidase YedK